MKYTDKYFRFPVRLYMSKDLNQRDELAEKLGITLPEEDEDEIPHLLGWETVLIDDIAGYGTLFSRGKKFEDVEAEGFDCTVVVLRNGREVGCSWTPEVFEKKMNQHAEVLEQMHRQDVQQRATLLLEEFQRQGIEIEAEERKRPWWKFWSKR